MDKKIVRWLSYLIGFILVLLPFQALLTTWVGSNTGHLDLWRIWKEILIAGLALPAAWLAWRSPKLKQWLAFAWLPRLIGLYFLLQLGIGVWALTVDHVNSTALIYAWLINLRFLGFFLICLVAASYWDWLKRHWRVILLGPAALVVLFGLIQRFLLPYDFLRHFGYSQKTIPAYQTVDASLDFRRIQSTLRGANPLGAYLVPVLTAVAAIGAKANRRLWWAAAGLASLVVLFYSYSRSAWIGAALALGLLVWWAINKRPGSLMIVAGLAGLIVASGIFWIGHSQSAQDTLFHTSSSSSSKQSSNAERVQAMKNGVRDVIHQPLGRGPGTAGPASFRNTGHGPRVAENYYLQIGQEVGVLGIALFVAINLLVARELWRQRQDLLSKVLLASLAGISFINLVSHAWTDDTLSLIWWGLAGISLGSLLNLGPQTDRKAKS